MAKINHPYTVTLTIYLIYQVNLSENQSHMFSFSTDDKSNHDFGMYSFLESYLLLGLNRPKL